MLSLKSFRTAAVTLAGVELAHRIRKDFTANAPELSSRHDFPPRSASAAANLGANDRPPSPNELGVLARAIPPIPRVLDARRIEGLGRNLATQKARAPMSLGYQASALANPGLPGFRVFGPDNCGIRARPSNCPRSATSAHSQSFHAESTYWSVCRVNFGKCDRFRARFIAGDERQRENCQSSAGLPRLGKRLLRLRH
jgi:hypothetical protein